MGWRAGGCVCVCVGWVGEGGGRGVAGGEVSLIIV